MDDNEDKIYYGYIATGVRSLGPGERWVMWVQGCDRRCRRCASPELQPKTTDLSISYADAANQICELDRVDGVTVSGGEPVLQYKAIGRMLQIVKSRRPEINVILFTGYRFEDLAEDVNAVLLPYVDVLVDGEYIDELNDNQGLRGSSNQRIHFLTDSLKPFKEELLYGNRKQEIRLIGDLCIQTIGIADRYNT